MAYQGSNTLSESATSDMLTMNVSEDAIQLPDNSYVRDADLVRDGMDLVLDGPNGTITIDGYFAAETAPNLIAPDGTMLTPDLVNSFAQSNGQYAQSSLMNDVSPVGAVQEVSGEATVIRADGSSESISIGTPIFQGDVVETSAEGAVNIVFIDETSFAVSEDARLAIDEYVFDPATSAGTQNFSVLKGVFVFTSGLIGREDPDDVEIDTPIGSIGIRGTIIAGNVDDGEITVVEGAIVLRDFNGNEVTLANQFETGRFNPSSGDIEFLGARSAQDVSTKFASVSDVSASLFSSIEDAVQEGTQDNVNPDGSVDQDNDGDVDSTIDAETDGTNGETSEDGQTDGDTNPPTQIDTTTQFEVNEFGDNHDGLGEAPDSGRPAPDGQMTAPPGTHLQNGPDDGPNTPVNGQGPRGPAGSEQPIDPNAIDNDANTTTGGTIPGEDITIGVLTPENGGTYDLDDGNDRFIINDGNTNTVNMGGGNDIFAVNTGQNNTINLGEGNDSANINDARNIINGGDGNDIFTMNAGTFTTNVSSATAGTHQIDGGGNNGGFGDVLKLDGGGTIDFTAITDDYFENIETIDLANGAANNSITLSVNDIFEMTDGNNELIITGTNADTIDVIETQTGSTANARTIDGHVFDSYTFTDGTNNVTVLVEQGVNVA